MHYIEAHPLTKQAFAPFGEVIETEGARSFKINNGNATRFHELANAEASGEDARVIMSICRGDPSELPIEIPMMERHPLGSQAFIPLQPRPFLLAVAPDEGGKPGKPLAFLAAPGQGVNYRRNAWHHRLIALESISDFLVVDRAGEGYNLEEYFYEVPYVIGSVGS